MLENFFSPVREKSGNFDTGWEIWEEFEKSTAVNLKLMASRAVLRKYPELFRKDNLCPEVFISLPIGSS